MNKQIVMTMMVLSLGTILASADQYGSSGVNYPDNSTYTSSGRNNGGYDTTNVSGTTQGHTNSRVSNIPTTNTEDNNTAY